MDNGLIATEYIPSRLQLPNMFTKGLPTKQFEDLTCTLGMINIHSPTWGGVLHNQENYAVIKCRFHFIFIRTNLLVILFYLICTALNNHYNCLSLPIISFLNYVIKQSINRDCNHICNTHQKYIPSISFYSFQLILLCNIVIET